jgi:hypothetical protein
MIIFREYKVKTGPWFHGSLEKFNYFKLIPETSSGVPGIFLADGRDHALQYAKVLADSGFQDTVYIYTVHLIRPLNIFDPFNSGDTDELFRRAGDRIFFNGNYITFKQLLNLMQTRDNYGVMESDSMVNLIRFWEGFVSWENNMRNIAVFKPRLIKIDATETVSL